MFLWKFTKISTAPSSSVFKEGRRYPEPVAGCFISETLAAVPRHHHNMMRLFAMLPPPWEIDGLLSLVTRQACFEYVWHVTKMKCLRHAINTSFATRLRGYFFDDASFWHHITPKILELPLKQRALHPPLQIESVTQLNHLNLQCRPNWNHYCQISYLIQ